MVAGFDGFGAGRRGPVLDLSFDVERQANFARIGYEGKRVPVRVVLDVHARKCNFDLAVARRFASRTRTLGRFARVVNCRDANVGVRRAAIQTGDCRGHGACAGVRGDSLLQCRPKIDDKPGLFRRRRGVRPVDGHGLPGVAQRGDTGRRARIGDQRHAIACRGFERASVRFHIESVLFTARQPGERESCVASAAVYRARSNQRVGAGEIAIHFESIFVVRVIRPG